MIARFDFNLIFYFEHENKHGSVHVADVNDRIAYSTNYSRTQF